MVIYQIKNRINNKIYIGSAVRYLRRFNTHKTHLRKNVHGNQHLQNAWNKFGEKAFKFEILEFVNDETKLIEREQYWIDLKKSCHRTFGYNIVAIAASNLGMTFKNNRKQTKYTPSEELRKLYSNLKKGNQYKRDKNKWPHEKGSLCKCKECKAKKNERVRIWQANRANYVVIDGRICNLNGRAARAARAIAGRSS